MRTTAQIIETIRCCLVEIEGRADEEHVITALWKHLAQRRPGCVMSLGAEFERERTATEKAPRKP